MVVILIVSAITWFSAVSRSMPPVAVPSAAIRKKPVAASLSKSSGVYCLGSPVVNSSPASCSVMNWSMGLSAFNARIT